MLNIAQGHHLQLRSCPPLIHNFWLFSVKVAVAHHPIIQKEVDELLAKGVIEPSSGGAGLYCSVFVVPKHTGGLWPIFNLKLFNYYLHIPSFKMPTIRHSGYLFIMVIVLSPLISRMLIYIFLLLSIIVIFYYLFGIICHISGKFYLLGWSQPLGFSWPSLNLSCSFAITRDSVLSSIWMISWSWFTLSGQLGGLAHFCVLYWFALDYILIFPSLSFTSLRHLLFGLMLGYCPYVNIFAS